MAVGVIMTSGCSKSAASTVLFDAASAASAPGTSIVSLSPISPSGEPPPPPETSMIFIGAATREA